MATSAVFKKGEAGIQSVFGTPVSPTFNLPFTGDYVDAGDFNEAELDSGRWIPLTVIDRVSEYATFTLDGAAFFELLPVFFNAGFADTAPVGAGPIYAYDYTLDLTTPGAPLPYTFRFGGGEDIGGTGPAIEIADAYCESVTLTGNMNSRDVSLSSTWFGRSVDDNSGAGYAFAASAMPDNLGMMRFPYGTLEFEDSTTTGGVFETMTALSCRLMDWTLTINTGMAAAWSGDAGALTYCGTRIGMPSIEYTATLRTDATTYANTIGKGNAATPTYQEIQFTQTGAESRKAIWQMTGRWLPIETAHAESNDELVITGTFRASGDPSQTTTPHAFGYEIDTLWSHT